MQKILIIKLGAFGDIVMSDGALRDIRAAHPRAHISVLTNAAYEKLINACPHIDATLIDPHPARWQFGAWRDLKHMLTAQNFDIIYDLQDNRRTAIYFRWLKKQNVKWAGTQKDATWRPRAREPKKMPALERLADVLGQAGITIKHTYEPDCRWLGKGEEAGIHALLARNHIKPGFILLNAGSSKRHPQKRWPHYKELATALTAQGLQPITAPGPDEMALCATLGVPMLVDNGQPLSFFQLAALIPQARFIIGNDTGTTHLAAYLGDIKGLALFGGHHPAYLTSLARHFSILEAKNISDISVAQVLEKIKNF